MSRRPPFATSARRRAWEWALVGAGLLVIHAVLLRLSFEFTYGRPVLERPTVTLVALLMGAGAIYLAAVFRLPRPGRAGLPWWAWVLGVGLLLRAMMLPATPMLESDYFRYLWDGGLVANGHNPYAHAPTAVVSGDVPEDVAELAVVSKPLVERVNQPQLRTIYPPVAQLAFAAAHQWAPWRIEGLRLLWLLLDLATLGLLVALLRQLALPASSAVIYWWNPLLIKELYNSAHMELVILPFALAALLLAVRGRPLSAGLALAGAVGAKLWPVLLLPVVLRRSAVTRCQAIATVAGFALLAGLLCLPLLSGGLDRTSGLGAYASYWQMNDALYQLFHVIGAWMAPAHGHRAARLMVGVVLLGWIGWLCRSPAADDRTLCRRGLWVVAALLLLSPTSYPWYWTWAVPLLAVHPSPGLLVLTATLPLYYLRFPLRELGYAEWFHHGITWFQFTPAFVLLAGEAWRHHQRRPNPVTSPQGQPT